MDERYLGDGVYASFDGYHIVLDLRGQDNYTRIALEPAVFSQLARYGEEIELLRTNALKETSNATNPTD